MSKVVLINPFEVPKGREEEALAFWDRVAAFMRRQPGYIATRLHKARLARRAVRLRQHRRMGDRPSISRRR